MIKARNRKLSMLLVLAMLMTMFVGVGTASAANVSYSVPIVKSVQAEDTYQNIGSILVTVDEASVIGSTYAWLLVALPSGAEFKAGTFVPEMGVTIPDADNNVRHVGKSGERLATSKLIQSSDRSLEVELYNPNGFTGEAKFYIDLGAVNVKDISGDVQVTLAGPDGGFFSRNIVTIAKVAGTRGEAAASIASVKTISSGDSKAIDIITVEEKVAGTFKAGAEIKLSLPNGFVWNTNNVSVKGAWGLAGNDNAANQITVDGTLVPWVNIEKDGKDLIIKINGLVSGPTSNTPGRIAIGNDANRFLKVDVQDSAKTGDVDVKVTVKNDKGNNILSTYLQAAVYGDYGVKVVEDTVKEVFAGRADVELGTFFIQEEVANSLVKGRTIILDLPVGAKWILKKDADGKLTDELNKVPQVDIKQGSSNALSGWKYVTGTKERSIRTTVDEATKDKALKALIEDIRVNLEPDFAGDLKIDVRGTAGVEGTVKVAEVKSPIKLEAKGLTNVVIGQANQKAANILIVENNAEAIMDDKGNNEIILELEKGVRFTSKPDVKVTEGDLEIDSTKLIEGDSELKIVVKYASDKKASTIEISNVNLTVDRTVPVGALKAYIKDAKANEDNSALDETGSDKSPGNVVIANVATPAAGGGVGEFRINSNIYYVNGTAKVMDVAPYIKDSRTYVPMRYVAEMLGAEVVWDDAARTVTLTKGDDVAVFTIGSTSYTVNGEAMTADVAPEIANSRTMLPARFVAEAFGAVVGWDAVTQTVVISQ